jgi:multidrug efflux pump subunit AcrA (membrane-fusion protein)
MGGVKKRLRWLLIGGAVVAAALGLLVLTSGISLPGRAVPPSGAAAPDQVKPAEPQPVAVTVARVTPRPVQRTVQAVGTFYGQEEVTVTPKVEGRVAKIHHDVGDLVKPGATLLEIDDVDYRLAVAEAQRALELELAKIGLAELPRGELDVAQLPTVVRARSVEANAQLKLTRALRLRTSGSVAQEEYDQAQADHRVAKAGTDQAVMEARATLAAARHKLALLDTARQRLAETKVVAPEPSHERLRAAGSRVAPAAPAPSSDVEYAVAQRLTSEGEMVRAFPSMAVFRLVLDRQLKLLATIPERHLGDIQVDQDVAVRVEAYPHEVFKGKVARVNPTVDRASRTFQIEVLVPNESRRLRAGGFAKATIFTRLDDQAPTVPEEALVTFAGVTKVFVVHDGKAHAVPVQPGVRLEVPAGRRTLTWLEVLGELRPGSAVVTSGQSQLAEGTPVRVRAGNEGTAPRGE